MSGNFSPRDRRGPGYGQDSNHSQALNIDELHISKHVRSFAEPLPQTEPAKNTGLIRESVDAVLGYAMDPAREVSEHARAGVKFKLSEGTLAEQEERLREGDSARSEVEGIQIEVMKLHMPLARDNKDLRQDLCRYLISPGLSEEERFATREFLEARIRQERFQDQMTRDSKQLAGILVTLGKPLRLDHGDMVLDDISKLTEQPMFWVAVLENCKNPACVRGTNVTHVVSCLGRNLELDAVKNDPAVTQCLQALQSDSARRAQLINDILLAKESPQGHGDGYQDGPDLTPSDL